MHLAFLRFGGDKVKNQNSLLYNRGSKKYVASLLSTEKHLFTKNDLNTIIYKYDNDLIVFYENKKTKKRYSKKPKDYTSKKYRKFTDVKEPRKTALKQLNKYLSELSIPNYVFAKTDGGYVKNAKRHKGNTSFLLIDIASFYPNCKFKYVKQFFMSGAGLKMKNDLAQRMAELVTVPSVNSKVRIIPQGFPTSTLISFFAYRQMFAELNKIALEKNLVFSTYVDDVTFSTNDDNFDFNSILNQIDEVLNKYGHSRKKEKTQICHLENGECPTITGIWIKRYKVRASSKIYRKLIYNYRWLISNPIKSSSNYLESWKHFVSLDGLLKTIDYIEPVTKQKRDYIRQYVKDHEKDYLKSISPYYRKIKSNYWKGKIYKAYTCGNLEDFYIANKDKIQQKKT